MFVIFIYFFDEKACKKAHFLGETFGI